MHSIFSLDSKLMQVLSRLTDLMILNMLFLLTCIPIITIGPSLAALYTVAMAMDTPRETGVLVPYFRAFWENLRCGLLCWLILLAIAAAFLADMYIVTRMGGIAASTNVVFLILLFVEMLGGVVVFPMMSLFRNTVFATLKNGMMLGLGYLPRTTLIVLLWAAPAVTALFFPVLFLRAGLLWILIYFSSAAYLSGRLLRKVFRPFLPENFNEE